MMNVNIINKLIKSISEQIPLVRSFGTLSPYEFWNVQEVKYGSVSFVITNVRTRETTTTYTASLYYADRLTEDCSNRDSIWSDSSTVIQTIVGALNQSDEYIEVNYPVNITLFEQDFADKLAGGYANIEISVEGMGECFVDELKIPEIVGTSAYFTKEEMLELFPTQTKFDGLYDAVKGMNNVILQELKTKLDSDTFANYRSTINTRLDNSVTKTQFDNMFESVKDMNNDVSQELETKLDSDVYAVFKDSVETRLDNSVTQPQFDSLYDAVKGMSSALAHELKTKLDSDVYAVFKKSVETRLDNSVSKQSFDNFVVRQNNTNKELETKIDSKLSASRFNEYVETLKSEIGEEIDTKLDNIDLSNYYNKEEIDNLVGDIDTILNNILYEK